MPIKVMSMIACIDPMTMQSEHVQRIGETMIEQLRHKLPPGAHVCDSKLEMMDVPHKFLRELRMSVYYTE